MKNLMKIKASFVAWACILWIMTFFFLIFTVEDQWDFGGKLVTRKWLEEVNYILYGIVCMEFLICRFFDHLKGSHDELD